MVLKRSLTTIALVAALLYSGASALAAPSHVARAAATHAPRLAEVHLRTQLQGSKAYPRVHGIASHERDRDGRDVEVEIWHLERLTGRTLVVAVQGRTVGTMQVSKGGWAELDRERGIPIFQAGQTVRVRTQSGVLVASGIFRLHPAH